MIIVHDYFKLHVDISSYCFLSILSNIQVPGVLLNTGCRFSYFRCRGFHTTGCAPVNKCWPHLFGFTSKCKGNFRWRPFQTKTTISWFWSWFFRFVCFHILSCSLNSEFCLLIIFRYTMIEACMGRGNSHFNWAPIHISYYLWIV